MKYIWIFNKKKLLRALVITFAFLFALGIIYSENQEVFVYSTYNKPNAIYNVNIDKKLIALTFDVSWGDNKIKEILDILEQYSLKGKVTFFLSSEWSENHSDLVKKIFNDGYEIGSHGYCHLNYSELSDAEIYNQIVKADESLTNITGEKPSLIRTPNGDFNKNILKIANNLDYTIILWDTDSSDWLNPGVDHIINQVLNNVHPGSIVLMHASDSCNQTAEALPIIITRLKESGYNFLSVSQLITSSDINSHEIK